jgi:hypothetical protein
LRSNTVNAPRVAVEAVWAGADRGRDGFRRVALEVLGAHDHRDLADRGAERKQQRRIGFFQLDLERFGVDRIERGEHGGELDADQVATHPSLQ